MNIQNSSKIHRIVKDPNNIKCHKNKLKINKFSRISAHI